MRYFHNFAKRRRLCNSIWEIYGIDKSTIYEQQTIKQVAREHFTSLYKDPGSCIIEDQLKIVKLFPSYLTSEDGLALNNPVTLKEVERTL